jgi:hypothetical protein
MKKIYKETGKYLYDISKIILGVAIITLIFKDGEVFGYRYLSLVIYIWGISI